MPQLQLRDYASSIHLKEEVLTSPVLHNNVTSVVEGLIETLLQESDALKNVEIPDKLEEKHQLLRALLNIREPKPMDAQFLNKLDALLQIELYEKGVVEVEQLENVSNIVTNDSLTHSDQFVLWQGDITRLNADAIVNAANNRMLGCFQPLHACIDNAIHSAAGPQLRNDCEFIMSRQKELEDTGRAKITRAYNLPSRFVLHTVGPIVPRGTALKEQQKNELASCYRSCLELAQKVGDIHTIAFCAISTGVFGFPKQEAAQIAVYTVNEWLSTHLNNFEKIVFNVFSEEDFHIYSNVFSKRIF